MQSAAAVRSGAAAAGGGPASSSGPSGIQSARTARRFSVSVPVLSVQMTSIAPSVSTAERRRTSARRRAIRCAFTASVIVMAGRSPSGTFATAIPMANTAASKLPPPRPRTSRVHAGAHPEGEDRDDPHEAVHLALEGRRDAADRGREAGDPPELGRGARRVHDRAAAALDDRRAGGREVARLGRGAAARVGIGVPLDRGRLAREEGQVEPEPLGQHDPRVGGDPIALLEHEQIARHELARGEVLVAPVAPHARAARHHRLERVERALRAALLPEPERAVQHDDARDRPPELGHPRDERQRRGRPEEQRHEVGDLGRDAAGGMRAGRRRELVRPVRREPRPRLVRAEPVRTGGQRAERLVRPERGDHPPVHGRIVRRPGSRGPVLRAAPPVDQERRLRPRSVSTTNQIANAARIHPSIRGRRAMSAIAAARTKASGQLIRSMRPRMIGHLDAAGDPGDNRAMRLPWWVPFGVVPETAPRRLAYDLAAMTPPQVVDVRTAREFHRGHVRGAISVPIAELRQRLPTLGLERDRAVVAICLTAHRSIPAVRLLQSAGFHATQLAGGMLAWRSAGYPEESGP